MAGVGVSAGGARGLPLAFRKKTEGRGSRAFTPRVGTRALPGLQVVRANNCLTEGLSEGEGSRGLARLTPRPPLASAQPRLSPVVPREFVVVQVFLGAVIAKDDVG